MTWLYFYKGEHVQRLMHRLKYQGEREIGLWMGHQLGKVLENEARFKEIDYVVPVPLHPKKAYIRGYNQSLLIATGLSKVTGWPVVQPLDRTFFTTSQTRKTKYERWLNVKGKFEINQSNPIIGRHFLVIDDIITTGATLESVARVLLEAGAESVSLACVGAA